MATARTFRQGDRRHGFFTWKCTCGQPGGRYGSKPAADSGRREHEATHGRKTSS
jgi:hypothetical protein